MPQNSPPPEELVERIAQGDSAAESSLVDRYTRPLYALLRQRLHGSPLDQDGVEVLLLPVTAHGRVTLAVTAIPPGGPGAEFAVRRDHPSRYRILLVTGEVKPDHSGWLETLARLTAAARAYAENTGEGRRRALTLYGQVVDSSLAASEESRAVGDGGWVRGLESKVVAQALYAEAVLYRLLGEHGPALDHARRAVERWSLLGDRRRLADTWNEIGLVRGPDGDTAAARAAFEAALLLAQELDDPFRQAVVGGNLCLVDLMEGQLRTGIDCFEALLASVRRIGYREAESAHLLNLAQAHKVLGETDVAMERYQAALAIQKAEGLSKLEAKTLHNLAGLQRRRGDLEAALDSYGRALARFERLGDERWRARTLHNLASTYSRLGDLESAVSLIGQALALHRRLSNLAGEASALKISGHLAAASGDWVAARQAYDRARRLERATGDRLGEAVATAFVGRCELEVGKAEAALRLLGASREELRSGGEVALLAAVQVDHGRALLALGRVAAARSSLDEALEMYERLEDSHGRGRALLQLALVEERSAGWSVEGAKSTSHGGLTLARLRQSVEAFDAVTLDLEDPDLRSMFAGSQRSAREKYVSALLRAGQRGAALAASETARAWALRSVLGPMDRRDLSMAHLAAGGTIDLAAIRQLLDARTVLLEYLVGDDTSHLFVVSSDRFEVFRLPGRAELETKVRVARRELLAGESATSASSAGRRAAQRKGGPPYWPIQSSPSETCACLAYAPALERRLSIDPRASCPACGRVARKPDRSSRSPAMGRREWRSIARPTAIGCWRRRWATTGSSIWRRTLGWTTRCRRAPG